MKKKLVLLMLSIAAVLCMIGFVACSNDTEDPPVTIRDPTLQEQYDAFCEFIENDTDKYAVSLSMEQAGEKVTEMLSVASDRIYGKMTSGEYSQESYVWLNEGYAYTRTTYNNQTEHSVEYMPDHSFGIQTMLNELSKELLYTEEFLASLQDNIAVANDAITFSFEDTQNGISCQNGTLTFAENSVKINFDLLLLNLPVYEPSDAAVAVQIEINDLGTNTVEFPFEPETEFAGITTLDRLYAQMVWVLDAESATLDVQMSGSFLTGVNTEIPFTMQLSGGEALAQVEVEGVATIAMGAIYKDDTFFYITETTSGAQSSMDVSTEEYGYTVARFFELFSFNLHTKEYFTLVSGSETKLTLSEQGKDWYSYCDELLIDFSKPGEYVISAELNEPDMPESLVCTIKDVGIEKEIEFPDSWKEYIVFYVDGIRYTDVSASGTYEVEATSLEQYNSDLIIPENITVNGQTYSVVSLNSNFLNGYDYALNSVVIPATVVNMNEALVGAYNLEFLYYGGTQASLEEVAGKTVPQGTIVYYYSEEQPQGEGNYWHWNEAHTAAERWPGGEEPAVQYQVYFDTNGNGYLDNSTFYASVIEEAPIPDSGYNGLHFAGWYTDPNCSEGNEVAFPYTVTEDITLYAKWEVVPFEFELNEEGTGYIVTKFNDPFGETQNVITPETHNGLPVTEIGNYAFSDCTSLESITIPSSVTSIGYAAFSWCASLTSVYVTDLAAWCSISFENEESNPLYYAQNLYLNNKLVTDLVIPEGLENIGDYVFYNCFSLESVTIPSSVTSIGYGAFSGCTAEIIWDEAPTITTIKGGFEGYKGTAITIPSSVTSIENYAFSGCTSLEGVYVTDLAAWCNISFENTDSNPLYYAHNLYLNNEFVTSLVIPDGVESIGDYAFSGCTSLISIAIPSSVTNIGDSAFYGCTALESVTFGEDSQLESIGYDAFFGCTSLTSITIPNSVTSIGGHAFYDCTALESITLPFVGAVKDGTENTHFGYIFGTPYYDSNSRYVPSSLKTVVITGGTSIGSSAFRGCSSIESITIPNSVTSIGSRAFNGCTAQIIWDGTPTITTIEEHAFSGYSGTAITIPSSVTSIENSAFRDCTSLIGVTFGGISQLTSIGEDAFYNCTSLTKITIPDSVIGIGDGAFEGCNKLIEVYNLSNLTITAGSLDHGYVGYYAEDIYTDTATPSKQEVTEDGLIFYADGENQYLLGYVGTDKEVTLPDNYNGQAYDIYKYAFYGNKVITKVVIPDSVTSIGDSAFYDCASLESVTFRENRQLTSIGDYAFYGCYSLAIITIPNSVTSIGDYAFYECTSLESITIPNGVKNICEYAFSWCTSLESVTIPDSVTSIGSWAFSGCTAEIIWDGTPTITAIEESAFRGYSGTAITIPSSVTSIGRVAFEDCTSLTNVTFEANSQLTSIGWGTFSRCTSLTSITIPNGVTSIGDSAFSGCTSLESVTFGENSQLTSIGLGAFSGCTSLTNITIPDSVTSIGESAFSDCDKIVKIDGKVSYVGNWAVDCDSSATKVELRNDTKGIASSAFFGCTSLTSIAIPSSVTSFSYGAFSGCTAEIIWDETPTITTIKGGFEGYEGTAITIPSSVTSIENYAFDGCTSLTSITIPSSVTSIGISAFRWCTSLESVYVTDLAAWCNISFEDEESNPLYYAHNLYLNNELVTDLVIPDGVESIGNYAFSGCTSLISIAIPNSVTSIGSRAFSGCTALESVTFGEDSQLESIDDAFFGCTSLTSITLPFVGAVKDGTENTHFGYIFGTPYYDSNSRYVPSSLKIVVITGGTSIGETAFYGCSSIESITIPNSVISIGRRAFFDCTSIESITIPNSVTSIGSSAFSGCTSLANITIPDTVTSIGSWAFDGCSSLESVTFGENSQLTSIGDDTFSGCSSLISIAIPSSVTSIGGWTFDDCTSLTSVTFGANSQLKSIGWDAFSGCDSLESVYYGGTAEKWAEIDIASGDDSLSSAMIYYYSEELTEEQKADGNNYWHYVNGVPTVWTKETI